MSRRGATLAIAAGLVLGAAVVLLIATGATGTTRTSDEAGSKAPTTAPTQVAASGRPSPDSASSSSITVEPSLPAEQPGDGSDSEVRVYEVGGRIIRDHRKGKRAPIDLPPAMHPADGRKLDSTLTYELGQKVKAIMKECTADLPPEARGVSPRIQGAITIAIEDQQVTVSRTAFQLRDVVGASVEPVKQCMEQKALAITHPTDETDLDSYDLTLSFGL